MRTCKICGKEKDDSEFYKLRIVCRKCVNEKRNIKRKNEKMSNKENTINVDPTFNIKSFVDSYIKKQENKTAIKVLHDTLVEPELVMSKPINVANININIDKEPWAFNLSDLILELASVYKCSNTIEVRIITDGKEVKTVKLK